MLQELDLRIGDEGGEHEPAMSDTQAIYCEISFSCTKFVNCSDSCLEP